MRSRTVVLAAMLAAAPLGARAADLVVWWEKGSSAQEDEAVAEFIAAFEQDSGKQVEFVLHGQYEVGGQAQAALEAGQAPDFLYLSLGEWITEWAYEGRLVDLEAAIGPVLDLFDSDAVQAAMLLNGRTARRGLYGLPMGRRSYHLHVWNNLLERAGFSLGAGKARRAHLHRLSEERPRHDRHRSTPGVTPTVPLNYAL